MNRSSLVRWISALVMGALLVETLFSAILPSQAQGNVTPTPQVSATPASLGGDDSDELPVLVKLSGKVQELDANAIRINDTLILLSPGFVVPGGVQVGTVVTILANLHNDDTLVIITVTIGAETPTPTPSEEATDEPAEEATVQATPAAAQSPTPVATLPAPAIVIPGCDKPKQQLAVLVSTTFDVPYAEVVAWRCKGFAFGVIARAYLLVATGQTEGKPVTVLLILNLRLAGKRWSIIIVELDVHPEPNTLIIVINAGGQILLPDCKWLKKWNKKLYKQYCKKPKKPKK